MWDKFNICGHIYWTISPNFIIIDQKQYNDVIREYGFSTCLDEAPWDDGLWTGTREPVHYRQNTQAEETTTKGRFDNVKLLIKINTGSVTTDFVYIWVILRIIYLI